MTWFNNVLGLLFFAPVLTLLIVVLVALGRRLARGDRAAGFAMVGCLCLLFATLAPLFLGSPLGMNRWMSMIIMWASSLARGLGIALILTPVLFFRVPIAFGGAPGGDDRGADGPAEDSGPAEPHRGKLILVLGRAGLLFTPAGIAAWSMGSADLRAMRSGRMDRSGERPTRVGRKLGIAAVSLHVTLLWLAATFVLYFILAVGGAT